MPERLHPPTRAFVEPETPAVKIALDRLFNFVILLEIAGVNACEDYISSVNRAFGLRPGVRSV